MGVRQGGGLRERDKEKGGSRFEKTRVKKRESEEGSVA